jgi:ankyrin repeat protein
MSVPALVNLPDSNGWSLVHHCVSTPEPSIEILDALYCAGADVSLFTTHEQQTPLHFLALFASSASVNNPHPDSTHSLHHFALHLIQDLRAPLSARDKNEETCIHLAAEYGHSIDLLRLFLYCDTHGSVRAMKNSRGLVSLFLFPNHSIYLPFLFFLA